VKQVERLGSGSIAAVGAELGRRRVASLFLVTGKTSFTASGAERELGPALDAREVTRFRDFSANPEIEDVRRGIESFTRAGADAVLAVGGGSAIDMAKLVTFFGSTGIDPASVLDQAPGKVSGLPPLIAVPTTAGSGSQATHFAVMYVEREKHSVAHPSMLPALAVVDPMLTASQSPYLAATAGMDALSQAVESYWSIHSTERSRGLAARALLRIVPNLSEAVHSPGADSLEAVALGAHFAGQAINLTKTTAPHAVSYPLTAYFGISHGHAVALTLPSILRYNAGGDASGVQDPRGRAYLQETLSELAILLGAQDVDRAATRVEELMTDIGLERRLSALGVESDADIETVLDHGFNPQRVVNNPRKLTRDALRSILLEIR
jgi:alcohol dehydrogenase class IV